MRRKHHIDDEAEINITPMLDIVFIMLIFFVVTTSFIRTTGAEVDRPLAREAATLSGGTILIAIKANDEIWMEQGKIAVREIRQRVERARAENPEGSVVVVADQGSRIGTVTRVLDQVRMAGVQGVALAAERPQG